MFGHNELTATVTPALYDTTITITHNMAISAADLTSGFPEVVLTPLAVAFNTSAPFVSSRTANTVVVTVTDPVSEADDAFRIIIRRPFSGDK
jgi:hypothetical protein